MADLSPYARDTVQVLADKLFINRGRRIIIASKDMFSTRWGVKHFIGVSVRVAMQPLSTTARWASELVGCAAA